MNKTLLLLAVSTLLFGCTKYGCTDELSTNYDAEVEKKTMLLVTMDLMITASGLIKKH